jgi:hypothetical protein
MASTDALVPHGLAESDLPIADGSTERMSAVERKLVQ